MPSASIGALEAVASVSAVLPPTTFFVSLCSETVPLESLPSIEDQQSIAGFVCLITYPAADGDTSNRLITCRRLDVVGVDKYVGAICSEARGYRQFRCDRILSVCDAYTGEEIGDGSFFDGFAADTRRDQRETWGLTRSRQAVLVAGLNVLAFMARCDGHWHQLEADMIEHFTCALWMRKGWEGDPPLEAIVQHANRLAPDGEVFASALRQYAHSRGSSELLTRYVNRVVAADGVICGAEFEWITRFDEMLAEARDLIPEGMSQPTYGRVFAR